MRVHQTRLKTGIKRTPEFERKRLASFAVNPGTKCGHDCLYCSTGASLRRHHSFNQVGEDPFGIGYAIVDPSTPDRVERDAASIRNPGLVQISTTVDAWAPEAQKYDLGRRCLAAVLSQPGWTVRILTKNAAVRRDFDLIQRHKDRVLVGLSITATPDKADVVSIIEPNASPLRERMKVMREAKRRGLRTYAMLCPVLPGIADSADEIDEMIRFAVEWQAEEIFIEPVNARGRGLQLCEEALRDAGFDEQARSVGSIRKRKNWSRYVTELTATVQDSIRRHSDISKLRILLYPSRLTQRDVAAIKRDDRGVVWLGKQPAKQKAQKKRGAGKGRKKAEGNQGATHPVASRLVLKELSLDELIALIEEARHEADRRLQLYQDLLG